MNLYLIRTITASEMCDHSRSWDSAPSVPDIAEFLRLEGVVVKRSLEEALSYARYYTAKVVLDDLDDYGVDIEEEDIKVRQEQVVGHPIRIAAMHPDYPDQVTVAVVTPVTLDD